MREATAPAWVVEREDRIRDLDRLISEAQDDRARAVEAWIRRGDVQRQLLDHLGAAGSYERAVALSEAGDERQLLARAMHAGELVKLKHVDEGLAEASRVAEATAGGSVPELRRARSAALSTRARALLALGRPAEARFACAEIVEDFRADPRQGPQGVNVVLWARAMLARALAVEGSTAESEAEYARLLESASPDAPGATQVVVAAQSQRAIALARAGRRGEAAELHSTLLGDYGDSDDPVLRAAAATSGLALCGLLLKDGQPGAVLDVVERIQAIWHHLGPYGRPLMEYNLALSAAQAHVQLEATDSAEATLLELLERPELLSSARRLRPLARVVSDTVKQLIAAQELSRASRLVNEALTRLRPLTAAPEDLLPLWSRKLTLLKGENSGATELGACQEIIAALGEPGTEWGRVVSVDTYNETVRRLVHAGDNRAAVKACNEAISRFEAVPEIRVRALVTNLKAVQAELELARRRPRAAARLYREVCQFDDENPTNPMAAHSHERRARLLVIETEYQDRRRVLIAGAFVPAVLAVPVVLAALRLLRAPSGRRGPGPRPRSPARRATG